MHFLPIPCFRSANMTLPDNTLRSVQSHFSHCSVPENWESLFHNHRFYIVHMPADQNVPPALCWSVTHILPAQPVLFYSHPVLTLFDASAYVFFSLFVLVL